MMFPDCPICHKEWDKNNLCVYHKDCSIIHGSGSDYEQEHIIRSYSNIGYALMWYVDGRCLLWSDAKGFISKNINFPYDISEEKLEKLLMLL